MRKICTFRMDDGRPCRMPPRHGRPFCWTHDPENAEAAAEARRLGGMRRRRERSYGAAFAFEGIDSVSAIKRLVEIAITDAFMLENSVARCRILIAGAGIAAKLLEHGDHEERIAALEAAVGGPSETTPTIAFPDPDETDETDETDEEAA